MLAFHFTSKSLLETFMFLSIIFLSKSGGGGGVYDTFGDYAQYPLPLILGRSSIPCREDTSTVRVRSPDVIPIYCFNALGNEGDTKQMQ